MNVLAFILALVGAVLNLFMPFISIPSIIDVNVASIYSMIFSTWDKLKDSPINGLGEFLLILLIMSILLAPINAFFASFDVLFRKKQTFFFKRFQYSPSVSFIWFAITSCIVALALGAISEALVQDFLKQAPSYLRSAARREMSEYVKYYVPLIWAACYGLAAMFTRVDEQNQKAHQEQLDKMNEILAGQKSQPTVSPENPQVTENIAKPETTNTEKTYEPVLGVETEALIKRANIFLEDEDFEEADRYFEQALNQDPENSKAYIGKLLVAKKVHNIDELLNLPVNLADEKLFQRALKFADGEEKNRLERYVQALNTNAEENERIEREKAELAKAEEAEREQQHKEALSKNGVIPLAFFSYPENNKQERISKVSAEAEKTEKPKTKTDIISVVVLVLILGGALYFFSNEGKHREVSDNSASSTTTQPAQSVHMPSNTENQPVKTKTEEANEYYSAGEEAYKEKNYQKAFENFTKAAELGNGEAQFSLARMYHEGEGVEKNLERSFYWLNKAHTTKPNYRIKFLLGGALYEGEGVDKDYKRAFSLFKEVAEIKEKDETGYTLEVVLGTLSPQMIAYAQMLVGVMYAGGNGVERDYKQAEYWLKKSIEGGNEDNQAKKLLNAIQSEMRSQIIIQPSETESTKPFPTVQSLSKPKNFDEAKGNAEKFLGSVIDVAEKLSKTKPYTTQDIEFMPAGEMRREAVTVYMRAWYSEDFFMFCSYPNNSWSEPHIISFRTYSPDSVFAGGIKVGSSFNEISSLFGDFGAWDRYGDAFHVNNDYVNNEEHMEANIHVTNGKIDYIEYNNIFDYTTHKMENLLDLYSGEIYNASITANGRLNIRNAPDIQSKVLFQVQRSNNDVLLVEIPPSWSEWCRVRFAIDGQTQKIRYIDEAYVSTKYIDIDYMMPLTFGEKKNLIKIFSNK